MGTRSYDQSFKEKYRQAFTVPGVSGNYANERITFGAAKAGDIESAFREISALVEGPGAILAGASLELWLPKVADGTMLAENRTDADYFNSAVTPQTVQGLARWQLSTWPGAQLRVKSGGTGGVVTVSASGY